MAELQFSNKQTGWSYSGDGVEKLLGDVVNNTGKKMRVSQVVVYLGTLKGYVNSGTAFTGSGSAISTYTKIGTFKSETLSITNIVGTHTSGNQSYSASEQCIKYAFDIGPIDIEEGSSLPVYIMTPALGTGATGAVLCYNKNYGSVYYDPVEDTFEIIFKCDWPNPGGSIYDPATGETSSELSYIKNEGTAFTIPQLVVTGNPDDNGEASHYTWDGYWVEGSTKYKNGQSITEDRQHTLKTTYPVDTQTGNFKVTWTDGYSGAILKTITVSYGQDVPQSQFPPNPSRPGYNFTGWLGNWKHVTKDTIISAVWGSSKIWIYQNDGWINYKPKEAGA